MPTHIIVDTDSTQTLTGKSLTSPTLASPVLSGTSSGTYTLDGTVTIDAPTVTGILTVAGQIAFPAAQNASAGANVLDDYEEGIWVPSIGGSATYTTTTADYTKVGRKVSVTCNLTINVIGTGSTTTISGLPFTSSATSHATGVALYATSASTLTYLLAYNAPGTATIVMRGNTAAAASTATPAVFGSGTQVIFSLTYFV